MQKVGIDLAKEIENRLRYFYTIKEVYEGLLIWLQSLKGYVSEEKFENIEKTYVLRLIEARKGIEEIEKGR